MIYKITKIEFRVLYEETPLQSLSAIFAKKNTTQDGLSIILEEEYNLESVRETNFLSCLIPQPQTP